MLLHGESRQSIRQIRTRRIHWRHHIGTRNDFRASCEKLISLHLFAMILRNVHARLTPLNR